MFAFCLLWDLALNICFTDGEDHEKQFSVSYASN